MSHPSSAPVGPAAAIASVPPTSSPKTKKMDQDITSTAYRQGITPGQGYNTKQYIFNQERLEKTLDKIKGELNISNTYTRLMWTTNIQVKQFFNILENIIVNRVFTLPRLTFKYGLDSNDGEIVFVMNDLEQWLPKGSTLIHSVTGETVKYNGFKTPKLTKAANDYDFKPKIRTTSQNAPHYNYEVTLEGIRIEQIIRVLVPRFILVDQDKDVQDILLNKSADSNPLNGFFQLYGTKDAEEFYSVFDGNRIKQSESNMYSDKSRTAMAYDSYKQLQKIYLVGAAILFNYLEKTSEEDESMQLSAN